MLEPNTTPWPRAFDITLAQGRAVWLRLIPVETPAREFGALDLKAAATRGNFSLLPLVNFDIQFLIAEDGFGVCNRVDHSNGNVTSSVAFAFITGEVWSIDINLLAFDDNIYFDEIAKHLSKGFKDYLNFLGNLGITPPYRWLAGIEGVSRMKLVFDGEASVSRHFGGSICMSSTVAEGGLYDDQDDPSIVLEPFFEKLFKKSGARRPVR